MAEPLSLAAGVAGLLSLTIQLLQITNKFKDDALSCKKDVENFAQELTELSRVLELLQEAWEEKRLPPNFDLSAFAGIEKACEEQLKHLLGRLTKAAGWMQRKSNFSLRGAMFRLKWPLEVERTREITDTIHRYFSIFSWALHYRGSEILFKLSEDACKILKDQDKILDEFRPVFQYFEDIRQPIDTATNISNSILKAVEGNLNVFEEVREDVKTMKSDTTSAAILGDIREETKAARFANQRAAEEARRARTAILENYKEDERKGLLDRIPTIPYLDKQRQAFGIHEPGTGSWFLTDPRYESWKNSDKPSVLLCQGAPGTGKTVLTSLAIDDVSTSSPEHTAQVVYLYCDYRNQSKETLPLLLSSLLRQLLTSERLIFPFVRDKCLELCVKYRKPDALVVEHIKLIRILAKMSPRTYVLVDAIDEIAQSDATSGRDLRLKFVEALSALSDTCHVFLTSRPHVDPAWFKALSASQKIEIRASDEDLSTFVVSSISGCETLRKFTQQDPTLQEAIVKTVQAKSQQIFLLASFHVRRLSTAVSPRDVRGLLSSLTGSLDAVYGFCLERLRCQTSRKRRLAERAMRWIANTGRPLTALELTHALSFVPGDTPVPASEAIDISMVVEVCDGLLRLEPTLRGTHTSNAVVAFTHSTIAEFMHQLTSSPSIHYEIANTSLRYLVMHQSVTINHGQDEETGYPFLNYATFFWGWHASKTHKRVDADLLLRFAHGRRSPLVNLAQRGLDYALRLLLDSGFSANHFAGSMSPLMTAAANCHPQCVSVLIEAGAELDYVSDKAEPYDTALGWAVASGDPRTASLLIRAGANLDLGKIPPLICAIQASDHVIAEQLIDAGCNPNTLFARKTPLFIALECKDLDMVYLLAQGGADVNATSTSFQTTPLQLALLQNQWNVATDLIDAGADVGKHTTISLSPLQQAAYEGPVDLVRALLQATKIDTSSTEPSERRLELFSRSALEEVQTSSLPDGSTTFAVRKHETGHNSKSPLHLALEARNFDKASLFIKDGIGINDICGFPLYTALEWATYQNEPTLVTQLLAAGADPNLGGAGIPLLSAVSRFPNGENCLQPRSTSIIAELLDAGATPHASHGKFRWTIHSRIEENIDNKWWDRRDPTVKRLRAALSLPEDWVVY